MVRLGDENLMSVRIHASIDVAGTEVMRVRHAVCIDPADRTRIADQDFVLVLSMTFMLSSNFCTLFQMLSRLPNIYQSSNVRHGNSKTGYVRWEVVQSPS